MDTMIGSTRPPIHERIAPISRQIWNDKYRLKAPDGTAVDLTIEDTWRRIASALAAVEAAPNAWERRFYEALRISASCRPAASCRAPALAVASPCSTALSWATSPTIRAVMIVFAAAAAALSCCGLSTASATEAVTMTPRPIVAEAAVQPVYYYRHYWRRHHWRRRRWCYYHPGRCY